MDLIFQATMSHDYMISLIAIGCYVDKKHSRKLHGRKKYTPWKRDNIYSINKFWVSSCLFSGLPFFPLLGQQGPIDLAQPGSLQRFGRICEG